MSFSPNASGSPHNSPTITQQVSWAMNVLTFAWRLHCATSSVSVRLVGSAWIEIEQFLFRTARRLCPCGDYFLVQDDLLCVSCEYE
jgi:hypothetical protein